MNDSKISVRYAKALFESAMENNVLDQTRKDMLLVQQLGRIEEFQFLLRSPVMKESQKRKLFAELLTKEVQSLTMGLIDLVLKNNRELYLPGIARHFEELYKRHMGIMSALLTSAVKMDASTSGKIEKLLKDALKSDIELATEEDKKLLGGFVIRIDDQQYDASVANKLKNIRKQLLN